MRYSFDTSAFLNSWRVSYPPDLFPSFWDKIEGLIGEQRIMASEEVLVELERKDDEVYAWARDHESIFLAIDETIQLIVRNILRDHPRILDTRKNRSGADPFVIALAQMEECTVVTSEAATNSPSRPHIPDVCAALGIRSINVVQLIRDEGWRI